MSEKLKTVEYAAAPPPPQLHVIERRELEDFLGEIERNRRCMEALAVILDRLTPGQMRQESSELLDLDGIAGGLSNIAALCANEMRLDVESFRERHPAKTKGELQ